MKSPCLHHDGPGEPCPLLNEDKKNDTCENCARRRDGKMTTKTNEYEDLTGKEVEYLLHEGIVVGYDYDIGITIVEKENPNNFLLCVHGRLSPVMKWGQNFPYKHYREVFELYTDLIKSGAINYMGNSTAPTKETCPFGQ